MPLVFIDVNAVPGSLVTGNGIRVSIPANIGICVQPSLLAFCLQPCVLHCQPHGSYLPSV